jgi:hypothetical protein
LDRTVGVGGLNFPEQFTSSETDGEGNPKSLSAFFSSRLVTIPTALK